MSTSSSERVYINCHCLPYLYAGLVSEASLTTVSPFNGQRSLKSACGTKVDGQRIKPHAPTELRPGGTVSFVSLHHTRGFRGYCSVLSFRTDCKGLSTSPTALCVGLATQGEDPQEYRLTGTRGKRSLTDSESSASGGGKRARAEGRVDQVQCRHLLIKHSASRFRAPATKPTSSNPLKHKAEVTRSKDEALQILQGHLAYLKQKFSASTAAAGSVDRAADEVCVNSAYEPRLHTLLLRQVEALLNCTQASKVARCLAASV